MKTASALTIVAVGAILAFAIRAQPSFLNLHVVGWVLIATGIGGLIIPRRGRSWLRRSVVVKGSPEAVESAVGEFDEGHHREHHPEHHEDTHTAVTDDAVERERIDEYTEN